MKSINIKGKNYFPVNERLKAFRAEKQGYALITEILSIDENQCTMIAKVIDPNGFVLATGHAHEEKDDKTSMVNKTSYVENCETSAIGRALGSLGYGIDEAFASADELVLALAQQGVDTAQNNASTAEPEKLTLEKAMAFKTKSGKRFDSLTIDQLEYIVGHTTSDEVATAANLVLDSKQLKGDLLPIDEPIEEGLPF